MTIRERNITARAIIANVAEEAHRNYWRYQYGIDFDPDNMQEPSKGAPGITNHAKRKIQSDYIRQNSLIKNYLRLEGGIK